MYAYDLCICKIVQNIYRPFFEQWQNKFGTLFDSVCSVSLLN